MDPGDFVASMTLFGVAPDGTEHLFAIGVGRPRRQPTGRWACPTVIHADREPQPIYGEDSLQSLCQALSFIRLRLESFLDGGGRLFRDGGQDEVARDDLASWFSRVGASTAG